MNLHAIGVVTALLDTRILRGDYGSIDSTIVKAAIEIDVQTILSELRLIE